MEKVIVVRDALLCLLFAFLTSLTWCIVDNNVICLDALSAHSTTQRIIATMIILTVDNQCNLHYQYISLSLSLLSLFLSHSLALCLSCTFIQSLFVMYTTFKDVRLSLKCFTHLFFVHTIQIFSKIYNVVVNNVPNFFILFKSLYNQRLSRSNHKFMIILLY